jgi:hypothetical protein
MSWMIGGRLKILNTILICLIALLSIAAGAAKVMGSPDELQFLQGFGFSPLLIVLYGSFQIAGGILLALPKTLKLGGLITVLAFSLSTVLILISGNLIFAVASILPIAITGFIVWQSSKANKLNKFI